MAQALVVYDSVTGHTAKMAKAIGEGLSETGLIVNVKKIDDTRLNDFIVADAIVIGSPTYFSNMTAKTKVLIDETVKLWPGEPGQLKDKVGAAFTSCGGVEGGNETTLLSIIRAMLCHGMIIVGHQSGSSGAISVEEPDEQCLTGCRQFGQRIASFVKK